MDICRFIWNFCIENGMTAAGTAAVLGNIEAESACRANNVENRCPMSDEAYTAAVDSGEYSAAKFSGDAYGYGLCQWTYPARKAELLNFARKENCSVGDESMQLCFMLKELRKDFPALLRVLKSSANVRESTEYFMRSYENPANQSENAIAYRCGLSQKYMERYGAGGNESMTAPVNVKLPLLFKGAKGNAVYALQALLAAWGKLPREHIDGIFGGETECALRMFQTEKALNADGIAGEMTWKALFA